VAGQDGKEGNTYPPYHPVMPAEECATKRIPVCKKTWEILHQLRKPGQTFDDVIRELVDSAAEKRLVEETRRIVRRVRFVPLSEINP
jgi:hypothetical protein